MNAPAAPPQWCYATLAGAGALLLPMESLLRSREVVHRQNYWCVASTNSINLRLNSRKIIPSQPYSVASVLHECYRPNLWSQWRRVILMLAGVRLRAMQTLPSYGCGRQAVVDRSF